MTVFMDTFGSGASPRPIYFPFLLPAPKTLNNP
jgi:hypothetical protein